MTRHCILPLLLGLALGLTGCAHKGEDKMGATAGELPTVTVTVAPLQERSLQRTVDGVGTLLGYDEMTLASKVSGRVLATYADLGDVILPGAVLMEVDPVDYRKDADRARRALDLELARLGLSELLTKAQFKAEDIPAVRKAQFELENAKSDYERIARLGGISERERDSAQTRLRIAQAAWDLAITEAAAGLTAAWLRKDELDAAELRLADCTVRAPYPSIASAWSSVLGTANTPVRYLVARKHISEGETVQANPKTDAFNLVIDAALKLPVPVPEKHISEVKIGSPVEVRVDAYPNKVFLGLITRISPTVDPSNRTFYPIVAIVNLDGKLKAGGFAKAAILTRIDTGVKTVPPQAVVTYAGVNKVFVIEQNKAKAVEVQLGTRDKDWIEILGNLPAGAIVATSGHSQLVDGSPVKIRE